MELLFLYEYDELSEVAKKTAFMSWENSQARAYHYTRDGELIKIIGERSDDLQK